MEDILQTLLYMYIMYINIMWTKQLRDWKLVDIVLCSTWWCMAINLIMYRGQIHWVQFLWPNSEVHVD